MALPSIDSLDTLGGILNDYSEVVDPTTDLAATASNASRADVAGMSRLTPRATVLWSNDGSSGTVVLAETVVGALATVTASKAGTGYWQITFPATCVDLLGQTQFWNFRWAKGFIASGDGPYHVQCEIFSPIVVDVHMWDENGLAADLPTILIGVDIY